MNRRDRAHQKKKKREEKQRTAKTQQLVASPAPPATSLPGRIARVLAKKTEETVLDAAAIGADYVDRGLEVGWAASREAPACKRGCSYCCHVLVGVTVPEIARLVSWAREHLAPADLARIADRARENAAQTHGKSALEYPLQLACALLGEDGACLAYEARPLMCRRQHSLDADDCKDFFENAAATPTPGEDRPMRHAKEPLAIGGMTMDTYREALEKAHVDASFVELQEALHIALTNERAVAEWLCGAPAFASARVAAAGAGELVRLRKKGSQAET